MLAGRLYDTGVRSKLTAPRPGSVPAHLRDAVGAWIPVRTDPDTGFVGEAMGTITPTSSGVEVTLSPVARIVPIPQMSEAPGHVQTDRVLPEAVHRVMRLVSVALATGVNRDAGLVILNGETAVSLGDLEAVLAEIPDADPRYPTMWAYEQACRTIRERDDRIKRALKLAEQEISGPAVDEADYVLNEVAQVLRYRMPVEPATPEQLSEVTRALELVRLAHPNTPVAAWVDAAVTLANEVEHLRVLGDTLAADVDRLLPWEQRAIAAMQVAEDAAARDGEVKSNELDAFAKRVIDAVLDGASPVLCPSCHHLTSSHYEDGSGCSTTIRDVGLGADPHCPCTFDARGGTKAVDDE
jgi:hypothetical protein